MTPEEVKRAALQSCLETAMLKKAELDEEIEHILRCLRCLRLLRDTKDKQ